MSRPLAIVGRFPPPLDGQAVATQTTAALLAPSRDVLRVDLATDEGARLGGVTALGRVRHYLGARGRLRRALAQAPEAPVIWTTVSPSPTGHARDRLSVLPAVRGRRAVGVVHHGDFDRLFSHPVTRRSARHLLAAVRALVFLSESLAERCAPWVPAEQRLVVPNTTAADTHLSRAAFETRRTRRQAGEPFRLLYLSGMIPTKGYGDVLEAVGVLHRRGVDVQATFAGRWPSREAEAAFRSRVDALGARERVTHLGGVSDREEVRDLYLRAHAFALPTTYPTEAQPLTILEAMNAGTPVLATAHAAIPEMVEDGRSGLLVPPHHPEALADAVESLLDPGAWRAMSDAARARYEAAFSPESVREQWAAVLRLLDA